MALIFRPSLAPHSFSDDFYQDAFCAAAVELAVKDLFPRAEIEFALGDGDHHFPAHDLPLVMGVAVVFAGAIVMIGLRRGIEGASFSSHAL